MDTIPIPPDLKEFLKLLNAKSVEYLLIGGYAVGYHGYVRATGDMDVWIATNLENAEKMASLLREFGFKTPDLSPELFNKPHSLVRMGVPPFRIEILTTISGVEFSECYAAHVEDILDGVPVKIIGLSHLKINKRASGRLKDLADLENLP